MVKITNGVNVFEVTRGAFEGIYSKQGYTLFKDEPIVEQPKGQEKSEDELFLEAIVEKPVSQWTKAEVKRFAGLKEIDISETKNPAEAKDLIKVYLETEGQE